VKSELNCFRLKIKCLHIQKKLNIYEPLLTNAESVFFQ